MPSYPTIQPAGDSAVLITFGDRIDQTINRRVHRLARAVVEHPLHGIGASVPGYSTLLIRYDPLILSYCRVVEWLAELSDQSISEEVTPRRVMIPVHYGGLDGPDLAFVAAHNHITEAEVIRIHASREYTVYLMGFTPGFPYLGGLDPTISAPRLASPRERVSAGSVGIAGEQTGIYPIDSPGGWRIIGRTTISLFDITRVSPFLLAPGDCVIFTPVPPLEE